MVLRRAVSASLENLIMQILDIYPFHFQPAGETLWWGSAMCGLASTPDDSDLTRIREPLAQSSPQIYHASKFPEELVKGGFLGLIPRITDSIGWNGAENLHF